MGEALCLIAIVLAGPGGQSTEPAQLYEISRSIAPATRIDGLVLATLQAKGIRPANLCSDAVFVRRVYLDIIGTLPKPREVQTFLEDRRNDKRALLIDDLLAREEFAEYWALKWCDLLRVKSEFPINLWPNAVQAYHQWIRDAIRQNMPYDQFARELLTSSGSNFRVPPVNFYRAIQGQEPAAIASAVSLTLMGVRFESWPEDKQKEMAQFFSRLAFKSTSEWKEEIVYLDPAADTASTATFPDGTTIQIGPGEDPRLVFADWLIDAHNEWFARNIVNRVWAWLLGRGIIHEPDDIRPDNPPVHPELLAYLEDELVRSKYDLRHIYRLVLNSEVYQQSCIPKSSDPEAEALFALYPVRRLDAEVLIDALCTLTGTRERYSSAVPEPFSFVPEFQRSIALADGSITSPFLEMFGRPARDTGLESERLIQPTDAQRLHLLNSSHIQNKIDRGWRLRDLVKTSGKDPRRVVRTVYMAVLSRQPTAEEFSAAEAYFRTEGLTPQNAAADLVWALINTKEFLYRH
jgi:hypothetical protein